VAGVLDMPEADRVALERVARSTVEPHRRVVHARALLALADGTPVEATAAVLGTWPKTVRRWRAKYLAGGVAAVGTIAPGRGRKRRVDADVVEAIVADTLNTVPEDGSTQWSTRAMAARHGVGKDFVAQVWRGRGIKPWKVESFKLSTDPDFEAKRWFKEITDKRIRRGSFRSVDELIEAVDHWSEHWNDDPKPFVWHRTAEEIIAKVRRGRAALDRVTKSAMHH
jgi:hypothetical protein